MDGIHDLGGMDGLGSIQYPDDGSAFHAEWERRVFAMQFCSRAYNQDEFRHAIERMDPAYYLDSPYFERWLVALETLLTEKEVLDGDELRERIDRLGTAPAFDADLPERYDAEIAAKTRAVVDRGASRRRDPVEPAFEAGDAVVVATDHPEGHTRCPAYVRRARGTVAAVEGTFPLPDASAHGEGEQPEPVYCVRFEGADLWGEDAETNTAVFVDLWERYLESP